MVGNHIKKIFFILLCQFSSVTLCNDLCSDKDQAQTWLTIVVHGIVNIKPHLSVSNIIRFMCDQINDTIYARAVDIMRDDPFFFQYSAMQGLGLQKIDRASREPGYASGAFALSYDALAQLNVQNLQKNIFYTFGWSGLLSSQVRYPEAQIFFNQMQQEVAHYKAEGINPKIRIIGYSHGGYIALNLGAVFNNLCDKNLEWCVDELILLGVPVISDTDFLVASDLFKKIYHFYSPGDRVQVVDCLATNRFFSHRIFYPHYDFTPPKKLLQIQLRAKRIARTTRAARGCKHHKKHYPSKLLRNADPGHTELWSFGWSMGYRSYLPLYPFPAGAYLGFIINALEDLHCGNHVMVDLQPFQDTMFVTSLDTPFATTAPFPTQEMRNDIACSIKPFEPTNCSKAVYQQKAQEALAIAHEQKREEWRKRRQAKFNMRFCKSQKIT